MLDGSPSPFARVMAVTHVVVVGAGFYALFRYPSWWFAALLAGIVLFAAYWIRQAIPRR